MVGLVIVSHSAELARSTAALARAVSESPLPVAHAGGVGEDRVRPGTDATEILAAIEAVMSNDGVLVLMDLGSAILSAETAVELLDPGQASRVRLCPAPLVEGAVAAAVQITAGASLDRAAAEAGTALDAKVEQLSDASTAADAVAPDGQTPPSASDVWQRRRFVLRTRHGLHVRPASRFIQAITNFDAEVRLRNCTTGRGPVNGHSLSRIATLGVLHDHEVEVEATGPDAARALAALEALARADFGEPVLQQETTPGAQAKARGERRAAETSLASGEPGPAGCIGISPGHAVGTAHRLEDRPPVIPTHPAEDPDHEVGRLAKAQELVSREIERQLPALRARAAAEAQIFEAHLLMLNDPDLNDAAIKRIRSSRLSAEQAWWQTVETVADDYRSLQDPYLQRRAADTLDVGRRVMKALGGGAADVAQSIDIPSSGETDAVDSIIVVAEELTPSQVAMLPADRVAGIVMRSGSSSSHSAILARALGYPAVSEYAAIEQIRNGDRIAMDGGSGEVVRDPDDATWNRFSSLRAREVDLQHRAHAAAREPAQTADGRPIEITANVGEPGSAARAVSQGAEGIGVLRTEFLFLDRSTPPDEDEQERKISSIVTAFDGRPVIVRTLDVGGDKELPFVPMQREMNPYLGVRGVRLYVEAAELLQAHFCAILRAARYGNVSIMIPMVTLCEEIPLVRGQLEAAHQSLLDAGVPHAWPVSLGIMIETPSAVFLADELARACDFFSIGSNDLTQYIMAAERGNARLTGVADTFHPAVLRAIAQTRRAAAAAGIPCSVCGEFAGTEEGAAALIGLGITKLSMNGPAIPGIKAFIRSQVCSDLESAAHQALRASNAAEARALFERFRRSARRPGGA